MTPPTRPDATAQARQLAERLENYYAFECEGGPLKNCVEWQALKRFVLAGPIHVDLVGRLQAVAAREDPGPIEPHESDACLEDVPEITIEERREIVGLLREVAKALTAATAAQEGVQVYFDCGCADHARLTAQEAALKQAGQQLSEMTPHLAACGIAGGSVLNGVRELAQSYQRLQQSILAEQARTADAHRRLTAQEAERQKGERVFQAVVYAFEGQPIPDDLREHGMVRRALKYRAAQEAEIARLKEWQPIDTAPKDGTEVLLTDQRTYVRTGWWARRRECWSIDTVPPITAPTHWATIPRTYRLP